MRTYSFSLGWRDNPSAWTVSKTWHPMSWMCLYFLKINDQKVTEIVIGKMIIPSKSDKDWTKTVASTLFTRFSMIWPTDLMFVPTWPIFELDRDNVKMIILSKFDDDRTKTVASRVFTRFFYELIYWPYFWPDITHIRKWPRNCQDNHSKQVWWISDQNVARGVFTWSFYDLTYWPSFWPDMTHIWIWPRYYQSDYSEQVW